MKLRKILVAILLAVMVMMPFAVRNVNAEEAEKQETETTEKQKVKVYTFEAGGCPYCEMQLEYLQGLEGYNKTFEVIQKEAFVDHNTWAQGADYDLAMKVSEAFTNAGFADASLSGTPYVVVSDLYAVSAYNDSLESIIEQAYEEGDKDVVGCIENGGENCMPEPEPDGSETVAAIVLCIVVVAVIVLVFVSRSKSDGVNYEDEYEEREEASENKYEKVAEEKIVEKEENEKPSSEKVTAKNTKKEVKGKTVEKSTTTKASSKKKTTKTTKKNK